MRQEEAWRAPTYGAHGVQFYFYATSIALGFPRNKREVGSASWRKSILE
jgi:hypothetical protein